LLTIQSPSVDDQALSDMVLGKVVLITGIDSPLGLAFCCQVHALQPKVLLCLDRSAKALEDLHRQLGPGSVKFILGDCSDEVTLKTVFEQHRPDVVCHLSVARFSLSVTLGNEWETLRQNMLPVLRSVRHAVEHESGMFIHITRTGEAAESPLANASLRLAEAICLAARNPLTRCVPICFGPELVLAHDGLISEMKLEIESGGPVSVSDPQSERCLMRETDAARLALQAVVLSMQSKDRNEDSVYVIRGGAPIRVADFARKLIKLAGFSEEQIPIVFTGSEKQPNAEISSVSPTTHPEILLSRVNPYLVTKNSLEEIASWLEMPTRNADQIIEDLSVWGIVAN
jgi:FlaA1/EpsC-like NDP-sugar epimerase